MILDFTLDPFADLYGAWQCLAWLSHCRSPGDWTFFTELQAGLIVFGATHCAITSAYIKAAEDLIRSNDILVQRLCALQQVHLFELDLAGQDVSWHSMPTLWNYVDHCLNQHRQRQGLW